VLLIVVVTLSIEACLRRRLLKVVIIAANEGKQVYCATAVYRLDEVWSTIFV